MHFYFKVTYNLLSPEPDTFEREKLYYFFQKFFGVLV